MRNHPCGPGTSPIYSIYLTFFPDYMASLGVPPEPETYRWRCGDLELKIRYSIAGLSTVMFIGTPGESIILDCGDGVLRDLVRNLRDMRDGSGALQNDHFRTESGRIGSILITHPHFDHMGGLFSLLHLFEMLGRTEPLRIIYPDGASVVENMCDLFKKSCSAPSPFEIELIQTGGGMHHRFAGFDIEAVEAVHRESRPDGYVGPPVPAVSYGIEYGGSRIVYSGDTGPNPGLRKLVRGADLAIIEATYPDRIPGGSEVHMTVDEAVEVGGMAREFRLVHFTKGSFERALEIGSVI